jgi:subtilase family serine protease
LSPTMGVHVPLISPPRRHRARAGALLGSTAVLLLGAAAVVPAADAATPATPHVPATSAIHLSADAHRVGSAHGTAARVAAIDSVVGTSASKPSTTRPSATKPSATTLPSVSTAYGVPALWNQGTTGAGTTVAVVESFGDPGAAAVLAAYSQQHGLPPAQLSVVSPAGPIPDCTPALDQQIQCTSWIGETDLDIVMIHAIAPSAHIVIAATPVNETQGFTGLPEMMEAIDYLVAHHLADAISLSFGTSEDDFPRLSDPATLDYAFQDARRAGIPVLAASGDCGATGNTLDSAAQCADVFPYRAVSYPASSPYVTAVGGTVLHLDATNNRTSPDTLWPASGAGLSKTYARPSWQNRVADITGSTRRSLPDITMEGIDGTSQASPLFAGVLALATQVHGGPLGYLNPILYRLGGKGTKAGIVDVTTGNDTQYGVPGFAAAPGYDTASGWGTVNPAAFVPALARAAG